MAAAKTKRPKTPPVELVMMQPILFDSGCRSHKFLKRPGWQTCANCPVKGFFVRREAE